MARKTTKQPDQAHREKSPTVEDPPAHADSLDIDADSLDIDTDSLDIATDSLDIATDREDIAAPDPRPAGGPPADPALTAHPTHIIGADIHAHAHAVTIIPTAWFASERWTRATVHTVRNNRADYAKLDDLITATGAAPGQIVAAVDRTGTAYCWTLARHLAARGIRVRYLNTNKVAALRKLHDQHKTDPNDARQFANLAHQLIAAGQLVDVEPAPDLADRAAHLRALLATRAQLVRAHVQATNRLRQLAIRAWPEAEAAAFTTWARVAARVPNAPALDTADLTTRQRAALDPLRDSVGDPGAHLAQAVRLTANTRDMLGAMTKSTTADIIAALADHPYAPILTSFPGIGTITAAAIIAGITDIDCIRSPKAMRSALGFGLNRNQSGATSHDRAAPTNAPTKPLLIMAVILNLKLDNPYSVYYRRQRMRGRHHLGAAFATAGKIAEHLWHALSTRHEYRPPPPHPRAQLASIIAPEATPP